MPAKNEHQPTTQLSEISTIRNILMGQQMSEYEQQFAGINAEISSTRDHFTQALTNMGNQTEDRIRQLEQDMNDRFDRLEKLLTDHVRRLDEKLHEVSKNDKKDLGQMMAELSKKLMNE